MDRSEVANAAWIRRATEHQPAWLLVATALAIAHFGRFYDADLALLTDTRYYTYFGIEVAGGAVPHLDFFGNKTQLASIVAAALVHLGDLFGSPAVPAIRVGFIALTIFGGVLLFRFHRTIADGHNVKAMLGLIPYLGLTYLGTLPASGSIPKLIMAIVATWAALLVARRSWFAAGLVAAISPLDWQIGLFACFGVFAAAALDSEARRALLHSAVGVGAVAFVFIAYFVWNGALESMFAQTIGASFARGVESGGPLFKFAGIHRRLLMHCAGEFWLLYLSGVGAVVFPFWFRDPRRAAWRQPLVVMAVYHYGVAAFSLIDFQGSGDTMLLLHTAAFFSGVALVSGFELAERMLPQSIPRPALGLASVVLMLAVARPVLSQPEALSTPDSPPGVTLQDQRAFARRLAPLLEDRSLLLLGPTEMLVLGGFERESIYVYWNDATRHEYARTHESNEIDLLEALIREFEPDVIVASRFIELPAGTPFSWVDLGRPGGYAVNVFTRSSKHSATPSRTTTIPDRAAIASIRAPRGSRAVRR